MLDKLLNIREAGPFVIMWDGGGCWIVTKHRRRVLKVVEDGMFVNYPGEREKVAGDLVMLLNAVQKDQDAERET